jgi:hypothetical protein
LNNRRWEGSDEGHLSALSQGKDLDRGRGARDTADQSQEQGPTIVSIEISTNRRRKRKWRKNNEKEKRERREWLYDLTI